MGRKNIQPQRRQQIIKALNRCLLKKPYKDTTIKDIAAEAGLNHGMLHYYFRDKEEILLNFVDYTLDRHKSAFLDWREKQNLDGRSRRELLEIIFQYVNEKITLNRSLSKVFVTLAEISLNNRKVKRRLKNLYLEWIALMMDTIGVSPDEAASHRMVFSIVAYLEGTALLSVLLNLKKDDHRQILLEFEEAIIRVVTDG